MAERDAKGHFLPGHHITGGRKPKPLAEDKERIVRLGRLGLDTLESIMNDPSADFPTRARVAIFAVEKAYGKARQEIEAATGTIEKLTAIMEKLDAEAQDDAE